MLLCDHNRRDVAFTKKLYFAIGVIAVKLQSHKIL